MNDDEMVYDEDDSVAFIKNNLPEELKGKFSNDDINYIVDLIYEFYEKKGYLDENLPDDKIVDIDEEELEAYVIKNAAKDKVGKYTSTEVKAIVDGEMGYCDSIHMFDN